MVVKCPRFAFEKFRAANPQLTTQMKSVGESMAIGRTFKEAFQKALRALETGRPGWTIASTLADDRLEDDSPEALRGALRRPTPERIFQVKRALEAGIEASEINEITGIDPWFLSQMEEILDAEGAYAALPTVEADVLWRMKRMGFADRQLADLRGETESAARARRIAFGIVPAYKMVDTCAGEFPSATPYLYSSYDEESEAPRTEKPSVVILGSGPNRIGQGVEFDYCCVRAALALRDQGYETIMINSNPETVSTDFDISDKLYFEPLTLEHVLDIVEREQPLGVIVQLGGQTPLKLTKGPGGGRCPDTRHPAGCDRHRRRPAPVRRNRAEAWTSGSRKTESPPVVAKLSRQRGESDIPSSSVRRTCSVGARWRSCTTRDRSRSISSARRASPRTSPVLIDSFLEDAFEADVDAISDGERVVIGGIMQHIEDAGIHSGDSACVLPPYLIEEEHMRGDARIHGRSSRRRSTSSG